MTRIFQYLIMFTLLFGNTNCLSQDSPKSEPAPLSKNRLLGIAITHSPNETFDEAFTEVQKIGVDFTTLPINWDDVEKLPENYNPDQNFLKIADLFYPANNIKIALELNPIDTVKTRMPSDLSNKKFDDPEVISRFKSFLDWSFTQIPNLNLVSLTIGNEVDAYLGNDAEKWQQYQAFFKEVSAHVKKSQPNLKVGTKITFTGLTKETYEFAKSINQHTDVVMTTYYPLNSDFTVREAKTVPGDFDKLLKLYPNKEISFLEIGLPSTDLCGSSEKNQAEFVKEAFINWDKQSDQIKFLNFTWLTDMNPDSAQELTKYYGVSNKCFVEFLSTLGLRTNSGKSKPALEQLKKEIEKRRLVK